jgi:alpha-tubulin suppressor-like RCC1 family protein
LIFPIRNADPINTPELKADANEAAVGSSTAAAQASIAAGGFHTCALSSGAVKCWGFNADGQLGTGNTERSSTPVGVSGLSSGVTAITAGYLHTCALASGAVKCWGKNGVGQLGDGTTTTTGRVTPVNVLTAGTDQNSNQLTNVTAITAGGNHTCALSSGEVKCWGKNTDGELGNPTYTPSSSTPVAVHSSASVSTPLSGVTAITAGYLHTCALLSSGAVKCWGDNQYRQLGDGTETPKTTPVNVLTAGTDQNSNQLTDVTAITAAYHHTCALLSSGEVKCWGLNNYG